jgi:hypothetical protein
MNDPAVRIALARLSLIDRDYRSLVSHAGDAAAALEMVGNGERRDKLEGELVKVLEEASEAAADDSSVQESINDLLERLRDAGPA